MWHTRQLVLAVAVAREYGFPLEHRLRVHVYLRVLGHFLRQLPTLRMDRGGLGLGVYITSRTRCDQT